MGLLQTIGNFLTGTKQVLNHPIENRGGWHPIIREPYQMAWQRNIEIDYNTVLTNPTIFACLKLISGDISKLRVKLVRQNESGIWEEFTNAAHSPVLRKPNHFQTRIQFWENWILSKLTNGNTYVLKQRDERNVVIKLYVLDPHLVKPLISNQGGAIFYELSNDNIADIEKRIVVPAREIIHDRWNCIFHPLVGVSPISASALAAIQGLNMMTDSAVFFANLSQPGGLLIAPGRISDDAAQRVKTYWETNFQGDSRGKIAVIGDGLKFQGLSVNAVDSQMIEQLKWTSETICSTFLVPPYKVGVGPMPTYQNIEALHLEYYSQCLQSLIEAAELCLDEGLELEQGIGTEFDTANLNRMDTLAKTTAAQNAIRAGFMAPNEARKMFDLEPVDGGETPYLQQQNFSLAALAKRDAKEDPFAKQQNPVQPRQSTPAPVPQEEEPEEKELDAAAIRALLTEGMANAA